MVSQLTSVLSFNFIFLLKFVKHFHRQSVGQLCSEALTTRYEFESQFSSKNLHFTSAILTKLLSPLFSKLLLSVNFFLFLVQKKFREENMSFISRVFIPLENFPIPQNSPLRLVSVLSITKMRCHRNYVFRFM